TVGLSVELTDALVRRELDLTLQNGPFRERFSAELPLDSCEMLWVAPPGRVCGSGTLDHTELRQHPILTHTRGSRPHQQISEYFATRPGTRARIVPSSNLSVCIELVLNGHGIACLPEPMVRAPITAGSIVPLQCHWTPDALAFVARFDRASSPGYVSVAADLAARIARQHTAP
ncbi:MAG: substrate-binding domain-containing protein, partial [Pseudomonadota bacterium]